MLPVLLHPAAKRELDDACAYLEERRSGWSARLLARVSLLLEQLRAYPQTGRKRFGDVRCVRVRGFQYLILYVIRSHHIELLAVFHTARNPALWRRRAHRRKKR